MVRTTNKKIKRAIKHFLKHKIPYTLKTTNQRLELRSQVANYSNRESELPAHELHFVKKVRNSIIKNELYKTVRKRFKDEETRKKRIKYFIVSPAYATGDLLSNCLEVDLNSAYWETAFRMGLLTEEIYQQGKTISKKTRLAAIGSLAKVTRETVFDGEKEVSLPPVHSVLTEHLWDEICYRVGKLVKKAASEAGKGFVFVWVDAMFISKSALPAVKKVFREAGYDYTVEPADWIQFNENEIVVKGKGKWIRVEGRRVWKDTRPFPFSIGSRMDAEKCLEIIDSD